MARVNRERSSDAANLTQVVVVSASQPRGVVGEGHRGIEDDTKIIDRRCRLDDATGNEERRGGALRQSLRQSIISLVDS